MDKIVRYALLACCILLAYLLWSDQGSPFVNLIVAPALGLLGSALLILLALGSMLHHSRIYRGAGVHEGSDT